MNWFMIFAAGLLGSSHCVGMCGGFALALGSGAGSLRVNLVRQFAYGFGRVFTYSVFGAAAGYTGLRLTHAFRYLGDFQSILSIAAGVLLVVVGLGAAGIWRRLNMSIARAFGISRAVSLQGSCLASTFFAAFLTRSGPLQAFLAGLVNGLLPCSLVYALLALAASSGDLLTGAATMGLFGLGTLPAMMLLGCGGHVLALTTRQHIFRLAAWCVVFTGVLTVCRGLGLMDRFGCPMCG